MPFAYALSSVPHFIQNQNFTIAIHRVIHHPNQRNSASSLFGLSVSISSLGLQRRYHPGFSTVRHLPRMQQPHLTFIRFLPLTLILSLPTYGVPCVSCTYIGPLIRVLSDADHHYLDNTQQQRHHRQSLSHRAYIFRTDGIIYTCSGARKRLYSIKK